jgi:hypothetical protein
MLDIQKEDLTTERLQSVWEYCNLKNKSPHIDVLTKLLSQEILKNGTLSKETVSRMCGRFTNLMVKKSIPTQAVHLETLPLTVHTENTEYRWNPATCLVFRPKNETEWIASRVCKGNRLYPLRKSHINVCISNGWYFETEIEDISSPFRHKE